MDVVAASLLVLFALVLVVATIARAATAHTRTGRWADGSSSGGGSWGVFSSDGGSDSGGGGGGGGGD